MIEEADGTLRCGPALEVVLAPGTVFDAETKYGDPEFLIPADLDPSARADIESAAQRIFRALGCRGIARVDFFLTADGLVFNEINTFPGFTSHSQVPRMFEVAGLSYGALLDRLVDVAAAMRRAPGGAAS